MNHIGLFDSGLGGLTILKELLPLFPEQKFFYFADFANLPYGEKTPEQIIRYCKRAATFLLKKDIQLLLIACHTASVYALEELQKDFTIPILGVTESSINLILETFKGSTLELLATAATIQSGKYQELLKQKAPQLSISATACSEYVSLIEQSSSIKTINPEKIALPLKNAIAKQVDGVLLACTHFPLLKKPIQKTLGQIKLIDPTKAIAKALQSKIKKQPFSKEHENRVEFYASKYSPYLKTFVEKFLPDLHNPKYYFEKE